MPNQTPIPPMPEAPVVSPQRAANSVACKLG